MATAGIVAEYNPFHRGHAWHIARTRRTLGADTAVICVMSGHWVQRGECALTDKWSRAALALSGGELARCRIADISLERTVDCVCRKNVPLTWWERKFLDLFSSQPSPY